MLTPETAGLITALTIVWVLVAALKTTGNYLDDAIRRHDLHCEVKRIRAARAALRAKRVERANPLLRSARPERREAA